MAHIAPAGFKVLWVLATEGPHTTRELRERLNISNSAAHKFLVNLDVQGLVEGRKCTETSGGRPSFRFSTTERGIDELEHYIGSRADSLTQQRRTLDEVKEHVLATAATDI